LNQYLTAIPGNMRFISFVNHQKNLLIFCAQTLSFFIIAILNTAKQTSISHLKLLKMGDKRLLNIYQPVF
jgi:hypothetical protein